MPLTVMEAGRVSLLVLVEKQAQVMVLRARWLLEELELCLVVLCLEVWSHEVD